MNLRVIAGSLAMAALVGGTVAADRATATAQVVVAQTQGRSNGNLLFVRRRLEAMIDQLQRDRHDYGGHRVAALQDLQAARNEILAAIAYQRGH